MREQTLEKLIFRIVKSTSTYFGGKREKSPRERTCIYFFDMLPWIKDEAALVVIGIKEISGKRGDDGVVSWMPDVGASNPFFWVLYMMKTKRGQHFVVRHVLCTQV